MEQIIEVFQYPWAQRALLAAILVGITCGILGCFIVLRNMALFGDALSHSILPGIVVAFLVTGYSSLGFFAGSVLAGLLTAVAIIWIQRKFGTKGDAAVGIVFTTMFALGVIGISLISSRQGVHLDLKDFLFGNVLGVSNEDLSLTGLVSIFTLLSVTVFYRHLFITSFQPVVADTIGISSLVVQYFLMLLLSFAVVASLQMVGVILVVAMLITPAAAALLLSNNLRWVLFIAALIGVLSGVIGLLVAIWLEIAPGPSMAVVASIFYLGAGILSPQKGMLAKWRNKLLHRYKIAEEDLQKFMLKRTEISGESGIPKQMLSEAPIRNKKFILQRLILKGLVKSDDTHIFLTETGKHQANLLVRAHRLWETYLVNQMGLTGLQIHNDAEKLEHLLPEELLDEVERSLGYPELDPHGSPIPLKGIIDGSTLCDLKENEIATIKNEQLSEHISAELWSLGLVPGALVELKNLGIDSITLMHGERIFTLSKGLARVVRVEKEQALKR